MEEFDLVILHVALVLKNKGQQCQDVKHMFLVQINLPTFSLTFIEFQPKIYIFHIVWQWKQGRWMERALSV